MKQPMLDPRTLHCPACNAPAGQPCNEPDVWGTGRRNVGWFHISRESRAQEAYERNGHEPIEPKPVAKMDTPRGLYRGACSCGWESEGFGGYGDARRSARQHADAATG